MTRRTSFSKVVAAYTDYVRLAESLGFEVNAAAFREKVFHGALEPHQAAALFSGTSRHGSVPEPILRVITGLSADLATRIANGLNGQCPSGHPRESTFLKRLAETISHLPSQERSRLAEAISKSPHGEALTPRHLPIQELHRALKEYAGDQTIARRELIAHLHNELKRHGIHMSPDSIEERFRHTTKVRHVPALLVELIRALDKKKFLTGLVPIETMVGDQDPLEWLEERRRRFHFRSHNSMHKAIAEATNLTYDNVHKALTRPRRYQRIQCEIRDIFAQWEKLVAEGKPLPVNPAYIGASAVEVAPLIEKLTRFYLSKEMMCHDISQALHISPASARKLMESSVSNCSIKIAHLQALQELLLKRENRAKRMSYLSDESVRRLATELAQKAEAARNAWRATRDPAMHESFRRLRLELIVALKESRAAYAMAS